MLMGQRNARETRTRSKTRTRSEPRTRSRHCMVTNTARSRQGSNTKKLQLGLTVLDDIRELIV